MSKILNLSLLKIERIICNETDVSNKNNCKNTPVKNKKNMSKVII